MRIKSVVTGLILLAATATATAAQAQSWYVGGFLAPSLEAEDVEFGTALGMVTTTFAGDAGLGFVAGREFGPWRFEIEWSLRDFDVKDHILAGAALPDPTGGMDARTYFANAIYDFNRRGIVAPYLGVGGGWADVEFDEFGVTSVPQVLQDDDSGFAWQVAAGIGINLGARWALFLDYRYLAAEGLEVTVMPAAGGVASKIDLEVASVQGGVRFRF